MRRHTFLINYRACTVDPCLTKLINKYQEVFGALPPPLSCKKLATGEHIGRQGSYRKTTGKGQEGGREATRTVER